MGILLGFFFFFLGGGGGGGGGVGVENCIPFLAKQLPLAVLVLFLSESGLERLNSI